MANFNENSKDSIDFSFKSTVFNKKVKIIRVNMKERKQNETNKSYPLELSLKFQIAGVFLGFQSWEWDQRFRGNVLQIWKISFFYRNFSKFVGDPPMLGGDKSRNWNTNNLTSYKHDKKLR